MKEVVFHYVKKCTLVVANKTTLLHGKDNTFRSGHPEVAERFDQILVRKHGTDKHAKGFNTWSHLVSMIFCQFAYGRHSSQYCCSLSSSGRLHTNGTSRTSLDHLGSTPLLKLISTSGLMSLSPHRLKRKMTHRGYALFF